VAPLAHYFYTAIETPAAPIKTRNQLFPSFADFA
jgi:hypothetical protein